ncbi:hypothetical protein SAMN04488493_103247 [Xylanibacter ruminicola]|nr:hypothetical protein SAMN04488493_103247 [Xylanibacter ruminicola]
MRSSIISIAQSAHIPVLFPEEHHYTTKYKKASL